MRGRMTLAEENGTIHSMGSVLPTLDPLSGCQGYAVLLRGAPRCQEARRHCRKEQMGNELDDCRPKEKDLVLEYAEGVGQALANWEIVITSMA
jgi:hypothetical protein